LRKEIGERHWDMALFIRLRIAFWEEYERAAHAKEVMLMPALYAGSVRPHVYWLLFQRHPALIAWMICPIAGYLLQRKELEFLAQERMVELMSISAVREDGSVDSRLAKVQYELYESTLDRVHGPVVQKVQSEQKSVNVNVNSTQNEDAAARTIALITDVEELKRRIEEVRKKREALSDIGHPVTIDQQKLIQPAIIAEDDRTRGDTTSE
jgi:hypothetical protein